MATAKEALEHAAVIVDTKAVEAAIVAKMDEFKGALEKANAEAADAGKMSVETKGYLEDLMTKQNALFDRLQALEMKGKFSENEPVFDPGAEFVKSSHYKDIIEGRSRHGKLDLKTAIINATGQNQPLVASDRLGGINTTPNRSLTIRDMLVSSTTDSNLIEFVRENAFTNNAGPQISGSPEAYENVTKPESAITFTLATTPVITLAHFIPASKQVLADSKQLQSFISGRLIYGLKLKEETQLLSGTGSNHQLNGLITQATAYTPTSPQMTNELDIIRHAIKQAHVAEYRPDFIVLNPSDWYDIEVRKVGSSDDRYVIGNPGSLLTPMLWGLPVVVTNSISAGTFLLGSSMGAEIKDREQSSVSVSLEDGNNFTKNMVTVLAEERLALVVYRTEAFITGSL